MGIRRGDLILRHGSGIISRVIQRLSHSYWDHVGWVTGEDTVLESHWKTGVKEVKLSDKYKLGDTRNCKVIRITNLEQQKVLDSLDVAMTHAGSPYDFRLVLHLLLVYLGSYWKDVQAKDWDCGFVCSELIAKPLWLTANFKFRDDVPVGNMLPGDLDFSTSTEEVLIRD